MGKKIDIDIAVIVAVATTKAWLGSWYIANAGAKAEYLDPLVGLAIISRRRTYESGTMLDVVRDDKVGPLQLLLLLLLLLFGIKTKGIVM